MRFLKYTLLTFTIILAFSIASMAQDKDRNDPPPKKEPPVVVVKDKDKPNDKPKDEDKKKPIKPGGVLPEGFNEPGIGAV